MKVCVFDDVVAGALCGYPYRKPIALRAAQVVGAHQDFPVLIALDADPDLAAHASADAHELVFTAADGATALAHEVESYQPASGALAAWVKVPRLDDSSDTLLYLYYGASGATDGVDRAAVWDSGFRAVWHLADLPTGQPGDVRDSTIHHNHGSSAGGMDSATRSQGIAGQALELDGADGWVRIPNTPALQITGAITVEGWFNTTRSDNSVLISKSGLEPLRGWHLDFEGGSASSTYLQWRIADTPSTMISATTWADISLGSWHYAAATFEPGAEVRLYIDGVIDDANPVGVPAAQHDPPNDIGIGARSDGVSSYLAGRVDELRVSSVARSADWIATAHANISSPRLFHSVAAAEALVGTCAP